MIWPILIAASLSGQPLERDYGRSPVIAKQGIVATSQVLASQAGARILAQGGSAVDAAIASNAVLGVLEPMMCGIGGDLFVLYWESKTGKLHGLNASGWAPKALTPDFLKSKGLKDMARDGIHSATVSGTVDGWARMHKRFGKLPWNKLFDDAIRYSDEGFPVQEVVASYWNSPMLSKHDESKRVFLPNGKAPKAGDIFRNPDLAKAYRLLAQQGPDSFYKGDIAKAIVRTAEKLGGVLQPDDLAEFSSEFVDPISTTYRGWRLFELPPNGQGMAAIQMLNMMETFPASPGGPHSAIEMHKKIESMKLAYADLGVYVADPRFSRIPVNGLISKAYGKERAQKIDLNKANCSVKAGEPPVSDTTYFSVVDREGNIASWIQSVSGVWGSGVAVEGMGFHLHNRGAGFKIDPKHPNHLAGRKRPFHTIIPAFLEKDGLHIGFGIMGGPNQPMAHAQFVSNIADYGMNIQAALEAARFTQRNRGTCEIVVESRVGLPTVEQLSSMGHKLDVRKAHTPYMGRGNAVLHDSGRKINAGASDSRADGAAIPEP